MNMNVSAKSSLRGSEFSSLEDVGGIGSYRGPVSEPIVCGLVALIDGICVLAAGMAAAWIAGIHVAGSGYLAGAVSLLGVFVTMMFWCGVKAYRFCALEKASHGIIVAALGLTVMIVLQLALTIATDGIYRANIDWLLLWFALCAPLLVLRRLGIESLIGRWHRAGRLSERVAVVGATPLAKRILEDLADKTATASARKVQVVGVFEDRGRRFLYNDADALRTESFDKLIELIRQNQVDAVIVALPFAEKKRVNAVIEKLRRTPVDVRLCPDYADLCAGPVTVSRIGRHTVLNVTERPLRHWKRVAKDIEDRVLGSLILLMIAPVMGLIALMIKIDSPGPVLFRQKRLGYNNTIIEVLKFRTMHHAMSDPNASQLTRRNDPRVTRLGAFLRRTSLDELPQFINVVRGDMSIVGPRPHALQAKAGTVVYQEAVEYYYARHRVKPGITGWAQINGWRGETETIEQLVNRVDHDLFYVDNWSVLMDLKIIVRTIFCGFTGKSAY